MAQTPSERVALLLHEAGVDAQIAGLAAAWLQLRGRVDVAAAQAHGLNVRSEVLQRAIPAGDPLPRYAGRADEQRQCAEAERRAAVAAFAQGCAGMQAVLNQLESQVAALEACLGDWTRAVADAEAQRLAVVEGREPAVAAGPSSQAAQAVAPSQAALVVQLPPPAHGPTDASSDGRSAERVSGAVPVGSADDGGDGAAGLGRATKRLTSTPMFRPADAPPATAGLPAVKVSPRQAVDSALAESAAPPAPVAPAKARSQQMQAQFPARRTTSSKPPPVAAAAQGPRARVLVDSNPDAMSRHADTVGMDEGRPDIAAAVARIRGAKRKSQAVAPLKQSALVNADFPADLPAAMPVTVPARNRDATAPFLATLSLGGLPLVRGNIEYDPAGTAMLVSFPGAAPQLHAGDALLWRDRDGTQRSFAVVVVQSLAGQDGGTVLVLATDQWSNDDRVAMAKALSRLI